MLTKCDKTEKVKQLGEHQYALRNEIKWAKMENADRKVGKKW